MYKKVKKEAKKVVSDAKCKAYEDLYNRLETREGEKDIFNLAKIREKVLVKDDDIKERWREYFSILLNEDSKGDKRTKEATSVAKHTIFRRIRVIEVRKALKQMNT